MTKSEQMKFNNAQFYYALLEFKDAYADEIFRRLNIHRQSLDTMSLGEIDAIIDLMKTKALNNIK